TSLRRTTRDTASPVPSTLALHDALPIFRRARRPRVAGRGGGPAPAGRAAAPGVRRASQGAVRDALGLAARRDPGPERPARGSPRSEEHTSELQSRVDLVCRLLLEKKTTA